VERQHLNPNGIQYHFFVVSFIQAKVDGAMVPIPVGCGGDRRSDQYISIHLRKSHKGWHASWFYVKSDGEAPLPCFTGRLVAQVPRTWKNGPVKEEKTRLAGLLEAIQRLKTRGLTDGGVVDAYHARRVAPIMARTVPLYQMVPGIELSGTVMALVRSSPPKSSNGSARHSRAPLRRIPTPSSRPCFQRPGLLSW
jgi:hypothetical protein